MGVISETFATIYQKFCKNVPKSNTIKVLLNLRGGLFIFCGLRGGLIERGLTREGAYFYLKINV